MNIQNSLTTALDPNAARVDQRGPRATSQDTVPVTTRAPEAPANAATRASARNRGALPVDAPEGTDPALWSILTNEERTFFARTASAGPLTYTKMMMPNRAETPATPMARGGRVDIRV